MTPLERKLIRRLVFAPETLSRNRNFHAFQDPKARAARRTAGLLRSLRDALLNDETECSLEEHGADWVVVVHEPETGLERRSHLKGAELAILCEDPKCAARLGREVTATE